MIIFMDGPNGSGKDYTIERIKKECERREWVFNTIAFKDIIEDPVLQASIRSRQEEKASTDDLMVLFETHLKYIDMIKNLDYGTDVTVVNRYCPSFYAFQYRYPETEDKAVAFSVVLELIQHYREHFFCYDAKYVNFTANSDVLLKRLLNRDNNVSITKQIKLQKFYDVFNETLGKLLPNVITTCSEDLDLSSLLTMGS